MLDARVARTDDRGHDTRGDDKRDRDERPLDDPSHDPRRPARGCASRAPVATPHRRLSLQEARLRAEPLAPLFARIGQAAHAALAVGAARRPEEPHAAILPREPEPNAGRLASPPSTKGDRSVTDPGLVERAE